MTIYLIMKNYNAIDFDDTDSSTPVGYCMDKDEADKEVERLNIENEKLIIKKKEAQDYMSKWETCLLKNYRTNKNKRFNNSYEITEAQRSDYNKRRDRYFSERNKLSHILDYPFEKFSYEVVLLEKKEYNI